MFGFRKKEKSREELLAVVDGTLIPIEDVKDPVFSQKMMGDGFAIASTGDTAVSYTHLNVYVKEVSMWNSINIILLISHVWRRCPPLQFPVCCMKRAVIPRKRRRCV